MSDVEDAKLGQLAAEVLANEAYTGAFALIDAELVRKWRETTDPAIERRAKDLLLVLGKVQQALNSTMESGKLARAQLELEQTRMERLGSAFKRRSAA